MVSLARARSHVTDTLYKSISLCMLPTSDRILNGISQNDDAHTHTLTPTDCGDETKNDVVFCASLLILYRQPLSDCCCTQHKKLIENGNSIGCAPEMTTFDVRWLISGEEKTRPQVFENLYFDPVRLFLKHFDVKYSNGYQEVRKRVVRARPQVKLKQIVGND